MLTHLSYSEDKYASFVFNVVVGIVVICLVGDFCGFLCLFVVFVVVIIIILLLLFCGFVVIIIIYLFGGDCLFLFVCSF